MKMSIRFRQQNSIVAIMFFLNIFSCNGQKFHIEPQYDQVMTFHGGICAVKQGADWGFIDTTGKWIFRPGFTNVKISDRGEYITEGKGSIGLQVLRKNTEGNWMMESYEEPQAPIITTLGKRYISKTGDHFSLTDETGNVLTKIAFDSLKYIGRDLFIGHAQYKDQLINASGKTISDAYKEIFPQMVFNRLKFKEENYSGVLSAEGRIVVKPDWWLLELAGKNIACTKGGSLQLYTDQLQLLSDFEFNDVIPVANGNWFARNTNTGESVLFNASGEAILDNIQVQVWNQPIMFDKIPVRNKEGNYGYINSQGMTVIPFNYDEAQVFLPGGIAVVGKKSPDIATGLVRNMIDTAGKAQPVPPFHSIEWHPDEIYLLINNTTTQILDKNFRVIAGLSESPSEYIGNGVYAKYKVKSFLTFQKKHLYFGGKWRIRKEQLGYIKSFHALDGTLLGKGKDFNESDSLPEVSEGLASAKKGSKWGFIKCQKK